MPDETAQHRETPLTRFWDSAAVAVATGLWVGFVPFAPGTVGALWGLGLAVVLSGTAIYWQLAVIAVAAGVGIPLCGTAARRLGKKDPGAIVWDEIVSLPMTFLFIPADRMFDPGVLATGFVLNRVFDISKTPPARQFERLPGGWGVMADDWVAGVYSCLSLHVLFRLGLFS